jgi:hypothetical protein
MTRRCLWCLWPGLTALLFACAGSPTGGGDTGTNTSGTTGRTIAGGSSGGVGTTTGSHTIGSSSASSSGTGTTGGGSSSGSTGSASNTGTSGAASSGGSTSGGWWSPTDAAPLHFHWELSPASGVFVYPGDVVTGETISDIDGQLTPASIVADLHAQGFIVICYMEVGSVETDRPDYQSFVDAGVIGAPVQGWPGEYWIDVTNPAVLPLIKARMVNWCQAGGFDAIEPDDSDVWDNNPGFPITQAQNDQYNIQVAQTAHALGFSIGLKNNPDSAATLEPYYDWSLNEQCFQYQECPLLQQSFLTAGKAVWDVEYTSSGSGVPLTNGDCTQADSWQMNAMTRDINLVGPNDPGFVYQPCIPDSQNTW